MYRRQSPGWLLIILVWCQRRFTDIDCVCVINLSLVRCADRSGVFMTSVRSGLTELWLRGKEGCNFWCKLHQLSAKGCISCVKWKLHISKVSLSLNWCVFVVFECHIKFKVNKLLQIIAQNVVFGVGTTYPLSAFLCKRNTGVSFSIGFQKHTSVHVQCADHGWRQGKESNVSSKSFMTLL